MPVLVGWAAVGLARVGARGALRLDLRVDAPTLLGAGDPLPRRLPVGPRADDAGRHRLQEHGRPDLRLLPARSWPTSLLFLLDCRGWGPSTGSAPLLLGVIFCALALGLWRQPSETKAMRLFQWSITYVTLLFGAMAVDQLIFH